MFEKLLRVCCLTAATLCLVTATALAQPWDGAFDQQSVATYLPEGSNKILVISAGAEAETADEVRGAIVSSIDALEGRSAFTIPAFNGTDKKDKALLEQASAASADVVVIVRLLGDQDDGLTVLGTLYDADGRALDSFVLQSGQSLAPADPAAPADTGPSDSATRSEKATDQSQTDPAADDDTSAKKVSKDDVDTAEPEATEADATKSDVRDKDNDEDKEEAVVAESSADRDESADGEGADASEDDVEQEAGSDDGAKDEAEDEKPTEPVRSQLTTKEPPTAVQTSLTHLRESGDSAVEKYDRDVLRVTEPAVDGEPTGDMTFYLGIEREPIDDLTFLRELDRPDIMQRYRNRKKTKKIGTYSSIGLLVGGAVLAGVSGYSFANCNDRPATLQCQETTRIVAVSGGGLAAAGLFGVIGFAALDLFPLDGEEARDAADKHNDELLDSVDLPEPSPASSRPLQLDLGPGTMGTGAGLMMRGRF